MNTMCGNEPHSKRLATSRVSVFLQQKKACQPIKHHIAALFLDSLSPINFGQRIIYVTKRVGFIWINIPTNAE
jgi:hypothetical protein